MHRPLFRAHRLKNFKGAYGGFIMVCRSVGAARKVEICSFGAKEGSTLRVVRSHKIILKGKMILFDPSE